MGILDRIQGKSGGKIDVGVEPAAAGPGARMAVRFTVHDQLDDKARSVLAGVTCTARYKVEERDRNERDGNVTTREVWQDMEVYADERRMELRQGQQDATFLLPGHVQPSSDGVVVWQAWARVDREKGIDVIERTSFEVKVPLESIPATRGADTSDDGLTLVDIPTAVREGDMLQGTLAVDVSDSVKARAVKVRLHRRVTYVAQAINDYDVNGGSLVVNTLMFSNESRITDDVQVAEVEVGGAGTFGPGRRAELPFKILVPFAGPTSSHQYAQVDWRLEAVLDRRLRGDKSVETPIIVV
jgi:hypothetical protein